jgi:hypothetical protein
VDADTEFDAIVFRCSGTSLIHRVLPLARTAQCINDTGKFDQQAVPGGFDDTTAMLSDRRVD